MIESKNNDLVKYVKKLARRRFRDKEERFVLEGVRAAKEAFEAVDLVDYVLYTPGLEGDTQGSELIRGFLEQGVRSVKVTEKVFSEISLTENPQGILVVAEQPKYTPEDIIRPGNALVVILDGVQDPGNLGNIIRTSAGAGADGVILLPGTVDLYNPKTMRSTAGNIFKLPAVAVPERGGVLRAIKESGMKVVAGLPGRGIPLFEEDLTVPVIVAVGSEAHGIQDDLAACSRAVYIPMQSGVESLNASMAAGIMLYEVVRQRYLQ